MTDLAKHGILRLTDAQHELLEKSKAQGGYALRAGKQEQKTAGSLLKLGLVRGIETVAAVSLEHSRCPGCKCLKNDALPCIRCDQSTLPFQGAEQHRRKP